MRDRQGWRSTGNAGAIAGITRQRRDSDTKWQIESAKAFVASTLPGR